MVKLTCPSSTSRYFYWCSLFFFSVSTSGIFLTHEQHILAPENLRQPKDSSTPSTLYLKPLVFCLLFLNLSNFFYNDVIFNLVQITCFFFFSFRLLRRCVLSWQWVLSFATSACGLFSTEQCPYHQPRWK